MIAACPQCQTRYRIDSEPRKAEGLRFRCKRCGVIFRLGSTPHAPGEAGEEETSREPGHAVRSESAPSGSESTGDRQRLVLVAHADPTTCKRLAEALGHFGLGVVMAHDGVEAILTLQRSLPRVVILDAALPKMYGFQVCELVKRNESLRSTWVILVGALHHSDRYHRAPSDLYGADAYLEPSELAGGLLPILRRFGLPVREPAMPEAPAAPSASDAMAAAPPEPSPDANFPRPPLSSVPESPPEGALEGLDKERAKAERLARIIVSDIVLYNEEKFEAGIREGDPLGAMSEELAEGRALLSERIDARVSHERDYLGEELLRAARARGGECVSR